MPHYSTNPSTGRITKQQIFLLSSFLFFHCLSPVTVIYWFEFHPRPHAVLLPPPTPTVFQLLIHRFWNFFRDFGHNLKVNLMPEINDFQCVCWKSTYKENKPFTNWCSDESTEEIFGEQPHCNSERLSPLVHFGVSLWVFACACIQLFYYGRICYMFVFIWNWKVPWFFINKMYYR